MAGFSKQELFCSICGTKYLADVSAVWQGFKFAVCGEVCFNEKKYRETLSILNLPYKPREENKQKP